MFTVDTNILIYYSAGDSKVIDFFETNKNSIFYLPTIVIAEFLSYPLITEGDQEKFKNFSRQTTLINLDHTVAKLSADIRKHYKLKLADAIIASSALTSNSSLVTRNVRDFSKIPSLKIITL
jgi:predicted nucleic acid-binding protein